MTYLFDFSNAQGPGSVEDVFCLTFEVETDCFGVTKKTPLKPGGGEVAVTRANREEYVRLYAQWKLEGAIDAPFEALQRGFLMMCNGRALELLRRALCCAVPACAPRVSGGVVWCGVMRLPALCALRWLRCTGALRYMRKPTAISSALQQQPRHTRIPEPSYPIPDTSVSISISVSVYPYLHVSAYPPRRPVELETLVVGAPHLDFKALEAAAAYEGGYSAEHQTIKNLWQARAGMIRI